MVVKELKKNIKAIDAEWLEINIPCQHACPIETDVSGYVGAIAEGDFFKAYAINREVNPFTSICGRVCAAPCQDNCRRGKLVDEPVSIRALKRFVADYAIENNYKERLAVSSPKGKSVAVIGGGPAGLSAADHLRRMGYDVTVFEAQKIAGGMMYLGIPEYRLPRDIIKSEIDMILSMGVELKCNMAAGRDFTISGLKKEYNAVFIAVGAHKSRELKIEGLELDGVLRGVDFLLNANLGYHVDLGKKVLVIGGGNVAIDVARVAVRKEKERLDAAEDITTAIDVARAAVRMGTAKEVHMICLESREEMPAHEEEVNEAINEGIIIHNSVGPKKIIGKKGAATGLEVVRVKSVFDDKGKFNPTFIEGSESVIEADTIVMAIGQTSDLSWISPEDGIEITSRNTIVVDPDTLATTTAGVFAGGDVAFGPRLLINAIADGKKAAESIDRYLSGQRIGRKKAAVKEMEVTCVTAYDVEKTVENKERIHPPTIPIKRRIGFREVEAAYTEEMAVEEARRCLRCNHRISAGGDYCFLCGICKDICPQDCIDMKKVDRVAIEGNLEKLIGPKMMRLFKWTLPSEGAKTWMEGTAFVKDQENCIRCFMCQRECPLSVVTIERISPVRGGFIANE